MEKRLEWIEIDNHEQANWLRQYLESKNDTQCDLLYFKKTHSSLSIISDSEYVTRFLHTAKNSQSNAINEKFCRNIKAAWTAKEKRKTQKGLVEGSYLISKAARNQLEKLANENQCSFSEIINKLLLNSKEISHLELKLKAMIKKHSNYKFRNINFFKTHLDNKNEIENRTNDITSKLYEKIQQLEIELKEAAGQVLIKNHDLMLLKNDSYKQQNKLESYERKIRHLEEQLNIQAVKLSSDETPNKSDPLSSK